MRTWLLVVGLLAACEDSSRTTEGPTARLRYRVNPRELLPTIDVMRERLRLLGVRGDVTGDGETLAVVLREIDRPTFERARELLRWSPALTFQLAVHGAPYVALVGSEVRHDDVAAPSVTIAHETWDAHEGRYLEDTYLRGPDPTALEHLRFRFPTNVEHQLLLEHVTPAGEPAFYRTHYVEKLPRLDLADVADAVVTAGGSVALTLTVHGTNRLSDLQRQARGRKVAIVLDRLVLAAPVVDDQLAAVVPGAPDPDALALVLKAGALSTAILEIDATFSGGT